MKISLHGLPFDSIMPPPIGILVHGYRVVHAFCRVPMFTSHARYDMWASMNPTLLPSHASVGQTLEVN
jgi:hypothetical protein